MEDFGITINKATTRKLKELWSSGIGINVKTKKEMKKIIDLLEENGLIKEDSTYSRENFDFEKYRSKTVLLSNGEYTSKNKMLSTEKVYTFEQIKNLDCKQENKNLKDIQSGNIFRLKKGTIVVVLGSYLLSTQLYSPIPLSCYNNDLTHKFLKSLDIVEQYSGDGSKIWIKE